MNLESFFFLFLTILSVQASTHRLRTTYSFDSSSTVTESKSAKPIKNAINKITTNGILAVDMYLHDDNNHAVGALSWVSCTSTTSSGVTSDCTSNSPIYYVMDMFKLIVDRLYMTDDRPEDEGWTPLMAAAGLYFELSDEQHEVDLDNPYGRCRRSVRETAAKDELQRVHSCIAHRNSTTFKHAPLVHVVGVDYEQSLTLKEADKTDIRSSEVFEIGNKMVEGQTAAVVTTDARLAEMDSMALPSKNCESVTSIDDCIKEIGAKSIGNNWAKIVHMATKHWHTRKPESTSSDSIHSAFHALLDPMGDGRLRNGSGLAFANLVRLARQATFEDFAALIKEPDHDEMLGLLADMLAAVGNQGAHKAAQTVLLKESPDMYGRYVEQLMFTPHAKQWMTDSLLIQMRTSKTLHKSAHDSLLLTVAALFNRLCEREKCGKLTRKSLTKFSTELAERTADCVLTSTDDPTECHVFFDAWHNLAMATAIKTMEKYICSKDHSSIQIAALGVIGRCPLDGWTDEIFTRLMRLTFDHCPQRTLPTVRHIAAQLILSAKRRKPLLISRVFTHISRNVDDVTTRELSAAVYATSMYRSSIDKTFRDYVNAQRREGFFANDWDSLATGAMSTVYSTNVNDDMSMAVDVNYAGGVFRSFSTKLSLTNAGEVFDLSTWVSGLDQWIGSSTSTAEATDDDAHGGMQLALFGYRRPRTIFFDSQSSLMTAVWAVDGSLVDAFNGATIVEDQSQILPLASGGMLTMQTSTAIALNMYGNMEFSLWNREAETNVYVDGSTGTLIDVGIMTGTVKVNIENSIWSFAGLGVNSQTEFAEEPYTMCMRTTTNNVRVGRDLRTNVTTKKSAKVHKQSKSTGFNDVTFANNRKLSQMCTEMNV